MRELFFDDQEEDKGAEDDGMKHQLSEKELG